tara:strand:+ start:24214 stop:24489 length:276 start_codon:yes stop_codon:yes gene_type:complete
MEEKSSSDSSFNNELSARIFIRVIRKHVEKIDVNPKNLPLKISYGFRGLVISNSIVPVDISSEKLPNDNDEISTTRSQGPNSKNKSILATS